MSRVKQRLEPRRRSSNAKLVDFFKKKDIKIVSVDRASFQQAVLKHATLESLGYDKKDYDRVQALK